MTPIITTYLLLAIQFPATIYGVVGEMYCGDVGKPKACVYGQPTATGMPLKPWNYTSAAIPLPKGVRLPKDGVWVGLRIKGGVCRLVHINDTSNTRWVGVRGLDLVPHTWDSLGVRPHKHLSGKVELCKPAKIVKETWHRRID
jgi:hypothetical protein